MPMTQGEDPGNRVIGGERTVLGRVIHRWDEAGLGLSAENPIRPRPPNPAK